jgi:hypothetical protein
VDVLWFESGVVACKRSVIAVAWRVARGIVLACTFFCALSQLVCLTFESESVLVISLEIRIDMNTEGTSV